MAMRRKRRRKTGPVATWMSSPLAIWVGPFALDGAHPICPGGTEHQHQNTTSQQAWHRSIIARFRGVRSALAMAGRSHRH